MTKVKESVKRVEDLKAQVCEFLGANDYMKKELIEMLEAEFLTKAGGNGEAKANEALKIAKNAINLVNNDEIKGILIAILLSQLPMGIQKTIIKFHGKLIERVLFEHIHQRIQENPLKGLAMAVSALKLKTKDE